MAEFRSFQTKANEQRVYRAANKTITDAVSALNRREDRKANKP